ncbi:MAG: NADH-quinone oxidoreductase subunit L [Rhodanobacteraceae bacterium]
MISQTVLIVLIAAPLAGALIGGLARNQIGRVGAAGVAIVSVALSLALSILVLYQLVWGGAPVFNHDVYTWLEVGKFTIGIGFLVDRLTVYMLVVVNFVSLMVHIYTIGYMRDDPGFSRFFAYIALFTFSMLLLVIANNFLQLFVGWELVGLVSYLLIGFWFDRPSANFAALKAFIVNRVGDMGFILGIAAVLYGFHTLNYSTVFAEAPTLAGRTIDVAGLHPFSLATLICLLLFVGAAGKSAQVPLHVWLPDSMEGPTPISALIHAATMVTAGVYMIARMSPLYEMSPTALSVVLIVGATGAFFMGAVGVVQNDIKKVIAYSTLSQLGYMVAALGASAYAAGMFHLMTHAFYKALLFLCSGSVIMAMHHWQDMRYMGGLRKRMPVTYYTMWAGGLSLCAAPGFSGFFSKDTIIDAVGEAHVWGHTYAYYCVLLGVFLTALYTFRMIYMTFHGEPRWKVVHGYHEEKFPQPGVLPHEPRESPLVVTVPLVLLAIPAVAIGWFAAKPLLYGNWLGKSIFVLPTDNVLAKMAPEFHSSLQFLVHSFYSPSFLIALFGFLVATYVYQFNPGVAGRAARMFLPVYKILKRKYWFDYVQFNLFGRGGIKTGRVFWKGTDMGLFDNAVNGAAFVTERSSRVFRRLQTGFLYHYAFAMIIGLILLLGGLWYWGLT